MKLGPDFFNGVRFVGGVLDKPIKSGNYPRRNMVDPEPASSPFVGVVVLREESFAVLGRVGISFVQILAEHQTFV